MNKCACSGCFAFDREGVQWETPTLTPPLPLGQKTRPDPARCALGEEHRDPIDAPQNDVNGEAGGDDAGVSAIPICRCLAGTDGPRIAGNRGL